VSIVIIHVDAHHYQRHHQACSGTQTTAKIAADNGWHGEHQWRASVVQAVGGWTDACNTNDA